MTPTTDEAAPLRGLTAALPAGWSADTPGEADAPELTALLRRHEEAARGWPGATEADRGPVI